MKNVKRKLIYMLTLIMVFQGIVFNGGFVVRADKNAGNVKYGFRLIKQTYIDNLKTTVMQYEHVKSGARLLFLKNDDPNKYFSIRFRTPPVDNSGINHIVEHCVLDGSEKYPVNLANFKFQSQSLCNTINALTFSDSTKYYGQSSNERDLRNLMSLMLDGVFYPKVLTTPEIFWQEAGHYELNSDKSKAIYNGTVYNEVRAGGDDIGEELYKKSIESLLPDTPYRWESGGKPDSIMQTKYEQALKTYKMYYNPSNSYIYLYGNINIDETLKYINDNYLSKFNKVKVDTSIKMQKSFSKGVERTYCYNAGDGDNEKNTSYFSKSYAIDKVVDKEARAAMEAICGIIAERLNKAAKGSGLNNICYDLDDTAQLVVTYSCEKEDENKKEVFKKLIDKTLNDIVTKGFTKEEINSQLAFYEDNKNSNLTNVNAGGHIEELVMKSWIYDGNPTLYLDSDMYINALKKELKQKYFEKLVDRYIINNKNQSFVMLKPQKGNVIEDKSVIEAKKLTADQLKVISEQTDKLKKWQELSSSKEALATLPMLDTKEIKIERPEIKYDNIDGQKVLFTPMETKGSSYCDLYFDTSMIEQDKIPYIKVLCNVLSNSLIQQKTGVNFNKIGQTSEYGKIDFAASEGNKFNDASQYSPKIRAQVISPEKNIDISLESLKKLICGYKFGDKEKIKGIIDDLKYSTQYDTAYYRPFAYFSQWGRYNECLNGLPQYNLISNLSKNFDKKWDEIRNNLIEVYNSVFNKKNLVIGFVGTKDGYLSAKASLKDFLKSLKSTDIKAQRYVFDSIEKNEAFRVDSDVINTFETGYNFKKLGYKYNGKMKVLAAIIGEKLADESRTNGGYGGTANIYENGIAKFDLVRMPDIQKSIEIFSELVPYLKNFEADKQQMNRYIISAVKGMISQVSPVWTTVDYQNEAINGKTEQDYDKEMNELLTTAPEDIRNMANIVEEILKQNVYFVGGSKDKINENKDMFTNIVDVLMD